MTTKVSWLKSLIISFGLFNWKVIVVINFVWMIIFLSCFKECCGFLSSKISWMKDLYVAHLVQISSVWTVMTLNSPNIAFSNLRSQVFEFPTGCFKNSSLTKLSHPTENILLPQLRTFFDKYLYVSHNSWSNDKILKANDFVIALFHRLVPNIPVIQMYFPRKYPFSYSLRVFDLNIAIPLESSKSTYTF